MRFMVVITSQFPLPPEQLPVLMAGFADWWNRYRDRWESAGFFASTNGGGGICNVADADEFHQMFLEWPLTPFSHIEAHALVDMDVALGQWQAAIAAMMPQGDA
jgi:hypothetical protein